MKIDSLIVTQHSLRHLDHLPAMIQFVAGGGRWTEEVLCHYADNQGLRAPPLIQISEFEDSLLYIHDGHHRITAVYLAGRTFLYPTEFQITKWTYEKYLEINVAAGWVTPFDPRTHCRLADIAAFKGLVRTLPDPEPLIRRSLEQYAEKRRFQHIAGCATVKYDRNR